MSIQKRNIIPKKPTSTVWKKWMHGKWLIGHIPFVIFLAILAIIYIGNGHYSDSLIRKTTKAKSELRQLQYQFKTLQADLIYQSKIAELGNAVYHLNLLQPDLPPFKLTQPK